MTIYFEQNGNFKKTDDWLRKLLKLDIASKLQKYGQMGVDALSRATPRSTGLAAESWGYNVESSRGSATITWTNHDIENGFPVVIMLQYGHGTGTGGYVQGEDFINPAIKPIFDQIADEIMKEVKRA